MTKDEELELLRKENQMLRARTQRDFMEKAIRDDMLSQVLASDMQQFYPEPVTPWYICILFFGEIPQDRAQIAVSPMETMRETYGGVIAKFGQPFYLETSAIVMCLLNVPLEDGDPQDPDFGESLCRELRDALESVYQAHTGQTEVSYISLSRVYNIERGPRLLFRSAVSASEHRTADSPAVTLESTRDRLSSTDLTQIYSLEPLFWRQVQQHLFYDAAITLDKLIELTRAENGFLEHALASVFSRMELVLRVAVHENGGDPMQDPYFRDMLPALRDVKTFAELRDISYDILATLEDRYYTPMDARNKKMPRIEAYLREHYSDPGLSAASVAETFKISPSYLSRIFKSDMGVGIVEYIHRLRVDKAKTLLTGTTRPLNEIAEEVGFSNRWVFNRVFKELEGTTPGAFRSR